MTPPFAGFWLRLAGKLRECDFLIVGAGIGGTSCAHFLSREHSVILLEMEDRPGYHTTVRSVAIYTEAYGPRTIRALAIAGGEFFRKPPSGFTEIALCRQFGLVFIAREDQTSVLYDALDTVKDLSGQHCRDQCRAGTRAGAGDASRLHGGCVSGSQYVVAGC